MFCFTKSGFKKYLDLKYLRDEEILLRDEYTTNLSFNSWKTFYDADPDNWGIIRESFRYCSRYSVSKYDPLYVYFPCYTYEDNDNRKKERYIKFLTRKDYRKFIKFYNRLLYTGEDYQNQKEILELAGIVGKRAKDRVEETQKQIQEEYKNMIHLVCNATEDDIQSYFTNKGLELTTTATIPDTIPDVYYPNSVPYKVTIRNSIKLYKYYADVDCMSEYLCYSCKPGTYVISEEKLVRGYVYCRIESVAYNRQNEWIRLSDIDGKESI